MIDCSPEQAQFLRNLSRVGLAATHRRLHGTFRYRDLRPPAQRDGCPACERFAKPAEGGQVLVTRARYHAVESHDRTGATSRTGASDANPLSVLSRGDVVTARGVPVWITTLAGRWTRRPSQAGSSRSTAGTSQTCARTARASPGRTRASRAPRSPRSAARHAPPKRRRRARSPLPTASLS
jgi:hypothetical protein